MGGAALSSIKQLRDNSEGNLSLGRLPLETKEEATSSWECCLVLNNFEFKRPENLWGQPQFGNVALSINKKKNQRCRLPQSTEAAVLIDVSLKS